MGIYGIFHFFFFEGEKGKKERIFWSGLLLSSLLFGLGTSLKWGSTPGYLLDFIYASLVVSGMWVGKIKREALLTSSHHLLIAIILCLCIPLQTTGKAWGRIFNEHQEAFVSEVEAVAQVVKKQGIDPGQYIFTHDFALNLFLFPASLFPQNDIVYCCAAPRATYDYHAFDELLAQQKLRYVIDFKGERPRGFLGQRFENFVKIDTIGNYAIWTSHAPGAR